MNPTRALIEAAELYISEKSAETRHQLHAAISSAKAAEEGNGWIDVKQELPEDGTGAVLVLVDYGQGRHRYSRFNAFREEGEWKSGHLIDGEITYWQPLPPPPTVIEVREKKGLWPKRRS